MIEIRMGDDLTQMSLVDLKQYIKDNRKSGGDPDKVWHEVNGYLQTLNRADYLKRNRHIRLVILEAIVGQPIQTREEKLQE